MAQASRFSGVHEAQMISRDRRGFVNSFKAWNGKSHRLRSDLGGRRGGRGGARFFPDEVSHFPDGVSI